MNKSRYISILLVFTILFTLFIPFIPSASAVGDSIELLEPKEIEEGIQLQWKTRSADESEESFVMMKNGKSISLQPDLVDTTSDQSGIIQRTYQIVDHQTVLDENYTYIVKKIGNDAEVQSEPIQITFVGGADDEKLTEDIKLNISEVTEDSIKLSWSAIGEADSYVLVVNGKLIKQFNEATSYELGQLDSQTKYSICVRALSEGAILKEAIEKITTAKKAEEPKSTAETKKESNEEPVLQNTNEDAGNIVEITDAALKRAIKSSLQLDQNEIFESDMENLTTLIAPNVGIKDLTGLDKAKNLRKLDLNGNEIKDATILKSLTKLEYLDLSFYQGENVKFLSSLTNLKSLMISDSSLSNLTVLSKLSKLETLDISYTLVKDLSPISKLTLLQDLNISNLELSTIWPVGELSNLKKLTIYGELYFNLVDEVTLLQSDDLEIVHDDSFKVYFSSINANEDQATLIWEYEGEEEVDYYEIKLANKSKKLNNSENRVTINELENDTSYYAELIAYNKQNEVIGKAFADFKTLPKPQGEKAKIEDVQLEKALKAHFGLTRDLYKSDLKTLVELSLERKRITSLSGLEDAVNLKELWLYGNKVNDLTPLTTLINLENLYVDENPIENFNALKELTNLKSLSLSSTGFEDLSLLSNLQKLNDLYLDQNNLVTLTELPQLDNLVSLSIYESAIEDLNGIENVKNLEYLHADNNPIVSIKAIEPLSKLRDVNLSSTKLKSIDSLLQVEMLQNVSLFDNTLLDLTKGSQAQKVIEQLENSGVFVDYEEYDEEWFDSYIGAVTEESLHVYWDYYGDKTISEFEIYVNGELYETVSAQESSKKITQLKHDTEYEIEVRALDAENNILLNSIITEKTWTEPKGDTIVFNDSKLKDVIKDQLGINRDPVESDLDHLDSLYLVDQDIKDLKGLEFAKNLYSVVVYKNKSKLDIAPLKNLRELTNMYIEDSPIMDYSILKDFHTISSLVITKNSLEDLSFLNGMNKLEDINLSKNKIKDISVLASLPLLYSINVANNNIQDISVLSSAKENLSSLEISGNPIKGISTLSQFEQLFSLSLDQTMITDLRPLLQIASLEYLSLFDITTLDLSEGSINDQVIKELEQWGVEINIENDNTPEIYIDEVTESSISISWDPMLPISKGSYHVLLYKENGEEVIAEIALDSTETSYLFTNLAPQTKYMIEVFVDEDEYSGYAYEDATTLALHAREQEVSMYVHNTNGSPEEGAVFELFGTQEETKNVKYKGRSNSQGLLTYDSNDKEVETFNLPIGKYEIHLTTEQGKDQTFEFELNNKEDYSKNPLVFIVGTDEQEQPIDQEDSDEQEPVNTPVGSLPPTTVPSATEKENSVKLEQVVKAVDKKDKNNREQELPLTASPMYNLLLIGLIVISFGGAVLFIQNRKNVNKS